MSFLHGINVNEVKTSRRSIVTVATAVIGLIATALALLRQEGRARISRVALSAGAEPQQAVITVTGWRTEIVGAPAFSLSSSIRALSALA